MIRMALEIAAGVAIGLILFAVFRYSLPFYVGMVRYARARKAVHEMLIDDGWLRERRR